MDRNQEALEVLAGFRGRAEDGRQAVRVADLSGLASLPDVLKSTLVASTPTQAEHNALVTDVHTLHKHLFAISAALQKLTHPR